MSVQGRPLVSVVTPVYNGEPYLRECIESVLAQTYEHWDYTIVNNRSTDRTLDIAREYAAKDSRIRIHENDNFVPIIENYNIAFRQISPQSKYCKVVAADDLLFPECLERMISLAEKHPTVVIVGAYGLFENKVRWDGLAYSSTVVPGREACRAFLLGGPDVFGTPTSVLYRSDIVRSRYAFHNEDNLHADTEACLEFLENHDFGFVHQVLTFQRVQENSVTSYSQQFQTYVPRRVYDLVRYGPKYLDEEQLKYRLEKRLQEYYQYLGRQVYKRRDREFWNFHREKLAALGCPLNTAKLAPHALSYAFDLMLNPKNTIEHVLGRVRRKWPLNSSQVSTSKTSSLATK